MLHVRVEHIRAVADSHRRLIVLTGTLFFLSGFAALLYQVAWQRELFAWFGVDLDSVSTIVSVFMLGLGVGAMAALLGLEFDQAAGAAAEAAQGQVCQAANDNGGGQVVVSGDKAAVERAVEIAQVAAIAMSAGMRVDELARVPLAFPTYTGNLAYAAAAAARQLELDVGWEGQAADATQLFEKVA